MKKNVELLRQKSTISKRPDGSDCRTISHADLLRIAGQTGAFLLDVEIEALEAGITPLRYLRNQTTLSNRDQAVLLRSHLAVIGLGGLGGYVTEILARLGIGTLTLVDGDNFDESNLNRQLLSDTASLGRPKAKVAEERLSIVNPAVRLRVFIEFLSGQNCQRILEGVDLAVDCLDTIKDRFVLESGCHKANIPFVSAAIAGTSGQLTVIQPGEQGLATIYGDPAKAASRGIEATIGTLALTAMHMAALQCSEVLKILLKKESTARHSLLFSDLEDPSLEIIAKPAR